MNKIHYTTQEIQLGIVLIAVSAKGICAIFFGDDAKELSQELQRRFKRHQLIHDEKKIAKTVTKIISAIKNPTKPCAVSLDIQGTEFQQRVWQKLLEIPVGATVSYTNIAERMSEPKSVRAVANACGANPIAFLIPCHRVVKKNGKLSGYHWGVAFKRILLENEGVSGEGL